MRAMGLVVVIEDGAQTSRVRALCRALIAWTPAFIYILITTQRTDLSLAPMQRVLLPLVWRQVNPMMAISMPISVPMSGAAAIGLAVLAVGAVYAAYRPARGIQDWLMGTWLVPR